MKAKHSFLMIKSISLFIVILISFSACKKEKQKDAPIYKKAYKQPIVESRTDLKNYLLTTTTPGISVAVSVDGKLVWSEGIGLSNKELVVPANRNTKFRIGNTSQLFTTSLVLKLQEQGLLNIDKSLYEYIPKFPKKKTDFSIRMLAAQTSGFPETKKNDIVSDKDLRSLKAYISKYENDSLVYEPGSYFLKSDFSIALLGILAETVTEKRFNKLVREELLDNLNLKNTVIDNPLIITSNRSDCYHRDYVARLINAPVVNLTPAAPAQGFLSTADDLNKAAQMILAPGILSQESINLILNPYKLNNKQELNRSFGWFVTTDKEGRKLVGQVGNIIGGSSGIVVYPEQKLVVSICANLDDEMSELPAFKIANNFLKYIDPPEESPEEK